MVNGKKIGILGGTFDPVHLGHLAMAETAADALGLARVIMVPAGQPVAKGDRLVAPPWRRLEMLRLAVRDRPRLEVSAVEVDRPGPSYTVDTITGFKKECGDGTELYFILGWDSLLQLPRWREPERIVRMCRLVAIPRPGCRQPDVLALEKEVPGIAGNVIILDEPYIDISATEIRDRISRGESIEDLVTAPVAEYIGEHRLYRGAGGKK